MREERNINLAQRKKKNAAIQLLQIENKVKKLEEEGRIAENWQKI